METVTELTYLGDRINSGGGCEAAVTSRIRLGWAKLRECQDLLCGKKFPLKIKGIAYKSCVRSAILHGSETWSVSQNKIGIQLEIRSEFCKELKEPLREICVE